MCHDTLWFCPSALERLELRGGIFSAGTKSVADKIVERLMVNGVPADQIVIEPIETEAKGLAYIRKPLLDTGTHKTPFIVFTETSNID